ncbi:hypothetical protein C2G38_2231093 [Gigaspora rosea]|uniref:Uncharacterized protein n=1 Tax=Gigaspora rosea TaxID=44941 RepID=A0A397TVB4_9GLOM|nr:hypothetical protein C2G38_2231093 [Gigaspora rosea]
MPLIAIYKKNLVLIQCKSVKKPIAIQMIKDEKYLTSNASAWVKSLDLNLKVCDKRFIVETIINNIVEGNDEEEIVMSNIQLDFLSFLNVKEENATIERLLLNDLNYINYSLNYVNNIHHRYIQNIRYNTSQQIKKYELIDETIEFFYMIIQKFNSVIGVRFMILLPENAKLCKAICEEIICHINKTTLQQEYNLESNNSNNPEKTDKLKVINKGKEKAVNKKRIFDNLAESSKVNAIPNWKCDVVILDQTHLDQKYFTNTIKRNNISASEEEAEKYSSVGKIS